MTRGRKKDLTIPATRALTQQRDYRARRAQYVNDLEAQCRALQSENETLRQEVTALRVKLPAMTVHNPQVVETSTQLMQDISAVTQTLSRFQHLVFAETNTFPPPMPMQESRYPSMPSPPVSVSSPPTSYVQPGDGRAYPTAPPRFPRDILNTGDHRHSRSSSFDDDSSMCESDDERSMAGITVVRQRASSSLHAS